MNFIVLYDILKLMLNSKLSTTLFAKLLLNLIVITSFTILTTSKVLAASAYISPASGLITNSTFKVSLFTESLESEPQIKSSDITISYPSNVQVVSIDNGDYDSYLQKTFDAAKGEIKVSASNTTGKSGKLKIVSISFKPLAKTGEVKLNITPDSKITGVGSEQLLTETVNSVYNLDVSNLDTSTPGTTQPVNPGTTKPEVPDTGRNEIVMYSILSLILLASGVVFYKPGLLSRK